MDDDTFNEVEQLFAADELCRTTSSDSEPPYDAHWMSRVSVGGSRDASSDGWVLSGSVSAGGSSNQVTEEATSLPTQIARLAPLPALQFKNQPIFKVYREKGTTDVFSLGDDECPGYIHPKSLKGQSAEIIMVLDNALSSFNYAERTFACKTIVKTAGDEALISFNVIDDDGNTVEEWTKPVIQNDSAPELHKFLKGLDHKLYARCNLRACIGLFHEKYQSAIKSLMGIRCDAIERTNALNAAATSRVKRKRTNTEGSEKSEKRAMAAFLCPLFPDNLD